MSEPMNFDVVLLGGLGHHTHTTHQAFYQVTNTGLDKLKYLLTENLCMVWTRCGC
jgi:hypothetical protein